MKNNITKILAVTLVIISIFAYKYNKNNPPNATPDTRHTPTTADPIDTSTTTTTSDTSTTDTAVITTTVTSRQDTISTASSEELFSKMSDRGVKFMDFFEMKEIANIGELTNYLKESTGLPDNPQTVKEEINKSLKSTLRFIQKYNIKYDDTVKTTYQDTAFHNTSLPKVIHTTYYPEDTINMVTLEKELTSQRGTRYLSDFQKEIITDLIRLGPIEYVSGDAQKQIGNDINTRLTHINKFFQLSYKKKTELSTAGEIKRWATIRYKLAFLANAYPNLKDKEKKFVIKYILHGGKRCDDAKLEATEALHSAYCKENKALLESKSNSLFLKTGEDLKSTTFKELVSFLFYEYRKDTLHNFLEYLFYNSKVYDKQYANKLKKDHATYYPATWNNLARNFGVKSKLARYPRYIAKYSEKHFNDYLRTNYNPQSFLNFVRNKRKKEYKVLLDRLNLELGYVESFFNNPKQKENIIIAIIKQEITKS